MISASKTTLNLNNLNILRPKVSKNLTNLLKTPNQVLLSGPKCDVIKRHVKCNTVSAA